jgi:hypothetical protein
MAVLPGVLGCRPLRRTVQVRKPTPCGCQVAHPSNSRSLRSAQSRKRVPSFVVSRQQFMKYPGWWKLCSHLLVLSPCGQGSPVSHLSLPIENQGENPGWFKCRMRNVPRELSNEVVSSAYCLLALSLSKGSKGRLAYFALRLICFLPGQE